MKRIAVLFMLFCFLFLLYGCGDITETGSETGTGDTQKQTETSDSETDNIGEIKMNIKIGNKTFTATLYDNSATRELVEMMKKSPITIIMNDYGGFEKLGSLGKSLPTDNHQITTSEGDIVLYNSNQIVMFYGSNSWSYTKIGKIDDLSGWQEALGKGEITVVFSISQ